MSYETEARRRKAVQLADWCRAEGILARDVIAMRDVTRRQACEDAGVNVASPQTWELVVGILGARAAIDEIPAGTDNMVFGFNGEDVS